MSTAHLVICVYHSEELLRIETEGDGEMRTKTLQRKSQEIPGPLAESQGGIASTSSQMSFKGWCICKGTAYLMVSTWICPLIFCFFSKELIQNADDAGAEEVILLYDERSFGTQSLFSDGLASTQGSGQDMRRTKSCSPSPRNNSSCQLRGWGGLMMEICVVWLGMQNPETQAYDPYINW